MTPIVSSTFDIAHWFLQRGELSRTFVSPLKLQRLLYLAQAQYAGQHGGTPLMPSVFVVSEVGPLEPNIYRAIEHEPPKVSVREIPEDIMEFVEAIWQEYGTRSIEDLNRLVARDPAYKEAEMTRGMQSMIGLDAMFRLYEPPKLAPAKKSKKRKKLPEPAPEEIPDFIAEILAAARDEAGESGKRERSSRKRGSSKQPPAWIANLVAGNG